MLTRLCSNSAEAASPPGPGPQAWDGVTEPWRGVRRVSPGGAGTPEAQPPRARGLGPQSHARVSGRGGCTPPRWDPHSYLSGPTWALGLALPRDRTEQRGVRALAAPSPAQMGLTPGPQWLASPETWWRGWRMGLHAKMRNPRRVLRARVRAGGCAVL